jgi:hypothetical protein
MTRRDFAEMLAFISKWRIENNPFLPKEQKELRKKLVDEAKKQMSDSPTSLQQR